MTSIFFFSSGYSISITGMKIILRSMLQSLFVWLSCWNFSSWLILKYECCWWFRKTIESPETLTTGDVWWCNSLFILFLPTFFSLPTILCILPPLQQRPSKAGIPIYMDSWHAIKETARWAALLNLALLLVIWLINSLATLYVSPFELSRSALLNLALLCLDLDLWIH